MAENHSGICDNNRSFDRTSLIVPSLFIAPFTGGIVILIFSIWEKTELIKNTFSQIAIAS